MALKKHTLHESGNLDEITKTLRDKTITLVKSWKCAPRHFQIRSGATGGSIAM